MTSFSKANQSSRFKWHTLSAEDILLQLDSSRKGLKSDEAARRLAQWGFNELKEIKPIRPWIIFFNQFKSFLIWLLLIAGILTAFLGDWTDSIAIFTIVILNAGIGFYQEFNAEKSIALLKKTTSPRTVVIRDEKVVSINMREVVPGDLIQLEAGDVVPADARLLKTASMRCMEAVITGESNSVEKFADTLTNDDVPLGDRKNMVFMGTSIVSGTGQAVIVSTGMQTEVGRIAALIEEASMDETTPLQKNLKDLGYILAWIALGITSVLFVLGLVRGIEFFEMLMTSVSLAVAAVPEGLPAMVTVALALGLLRMSRRRALIRRLPAVETLGSTNVICTDKTGTLTVGQMTARELFVNGKIFQVTGEGYGADGEIFFLGKAPATEDILPLMQLADILIGCNNAHLTFEDGMWRMIGDPTEGALITVGCKIGRDREQLERKFPLCHEIPFDSDRKCHTMIRRVAEGELRVFINGAPDVLIEHCSKIYDHTGARLLTEEDRQRIAQMNAEMANRALRVIGSAYRDLSEKHSESLTAENIERDLIFVGLTGMYDPPRFEVKEAIAKCHAAGVRVVMITGDHPHTGKAIAQEINIIKPDDMVLTGADLDKLTDHQLQQRIEHISIYARVSAEHKLRIVRAWKAEGSVVAMTGDGVNDAPAIKGADIGIAMGITGTEVTKQAADMIITDDNFVSIVAAVEEGRGIYDNIRKTLQYLLAGNCGELMLMTFCIVIGLPAPLLPIHLLWINLVTDGLPALCLAMDPIDPDIMKYPPRDQSQKMADRRFFMKVGLIGFLTATVCLGVYLYSLQYETLEVARTKAFTVLVGAELFRAFCARSESKPIWKIPAVSNASLILVVSLSLIFQIWIHYNEWLSKFLKVAEISFQDCLILLAIAILPSIFLEILKVVRKPVRRV